MGRAWRPREPRRNPTARNDPFDCVACGAHVPATEHGLPRNHCPFCLVSRHVDDATPGDRAAECGGAMTAVRYEVRSGGVLYLIHRCDVCGVERLVRAVVPPEPFPDRWELLDPRPS